jgi:ArsR family transcriptional regulator
MSKRSYVPSRPLGQASAVALAETFKVLGDVTRVRLLDALARVRGAGAPGLNNAICVQDLAARLGMTQSAVSHQLRLLRSMRLVRTRRAGRQIFYALDDHHIVKLFEQGLEHVEEQLGVGRAVQARRPGPHRAGPRSRPRASRPEGRAAS